VSKKSEPFDLVGDAVALDMSLLGNPNGDG
jgi:hypothetical protein